MLRWTNADGRQGVCPLTGKELVIGRHSDASLVLSAWSVSHHHAKIVRNEQGFSLINLESRRGTYVNGQPIQECQLRHGDPIRLGKEGVELLYVLGEAGTSHLTTPAPGYDFEKSFREIASILTPEKPIYSDLEKISCILDFHYAWGTGFSAEKTFEQILKSALQISGAERGFILLQQPEGLRYAMGLDLHGALLPQSDFRGSQTVVRRATEGGSLIFMTQEIAGEFAQQQNIVSTNVRAIAYLPLEGISSRSQTPEVVGILYLENTRKMHALSGLDQKILTKLAEEAGTVLEKLEMIKELEERKKIEQKLALAQETQPSLLPRSLPQYENLRLHAFNHPTRYVGGDFYDFLELSAGDRVGVLADVSGKGISTALLSSLLQRALHMEFCSATAPHEVLNRLNKVLSERTPPERFVTLFLIALGAEGTGQFIGAGHNPAYLFRSASGEIEELASGSLMLGAFPFASYQGCPLRLDKGDILLVFSDGLTEAQNPQEEMFGEERLKEILRREAPAGSENLERKLLGAVEEFTRGAGQSDDITFLLVEKCG